MLRNKFNKLAIVSILCIIILSFLVPIVRADDETNTSNDEDTMPINNEEDTTQQENMEQKDVYLVEDNVTIDYVIDGNLYVLANNVTINSQIGGDAFICAKTLTIDTEGQIYSNLFAFADSIDIKGIVYDLYAASKNTTISGYVYRDVHVGSDIVNILGSVGRNAFIDCSELKIEESTNTDNEEDSADNISHGVINGNLNYTANEEIQLPEDAVVGETNFKKSSIINASTTENYIMSLGSLVATVVIIWLLCLWLAPKFLKNNTPLLTSKKILPVIGFGILTPIVAIIASIILFVLGITYTLGILLLVTLFMLLAISTSVLIITINNIICEKLKIEKVLGQLGVLIICSAILWAIGFIPYIGSLIGIIVVILGLGIVTYNLFSQIKKEN